MATAFDSEKRFLASRTFWSNIVGFLMIVGSMLGVRIGAIDEGALVEALMQASAGVAFVLSTFFRIVATHRLSP